MLRTVLCLLALHLAAGPAAAAEPAVPEVAYRTTGVRGLVFVNNPEMIFAEELAEAGRSLHRDTLAAGAWRTWSQHWNRSGGPLVLAVALTNPGPERIRVRCTAAAPGAWADEFPAAWNDPRAWERDLEPGASAWLFRSATIAPGAACGGVADFATDGAVIITHLAARGDPAAVEPAALAPVGYVTRTWGERHREARVYKGSASAAAVRLDLAWSIDDDDRGTLPVRRRPFVSATAGWGDPVPSANGWRTHISIGHQPDATMSDMLAFKDPAWPVPFDPARPSDALGMIPNVGNWGVMYEHRFTITNRGTRPRAVAARIAGKGLHLAHRAAPDAPWVKASVVRPGHLDWSVATIPPGGTGTIDGRWILGGPANGDIVQSAVLLDDPVP